MATSAQVDALVALYAGYFNRAPDPAGLQFWIDQIDGGREFNTIAADFAASPEATALYPYLTAPDVATPSTFITSVYQNLFNRAPDAEGLQFWTDVLASGSVSVADMIEAIINGAVDAPNATPPTFDKTTLDNKVEVGLDFAVDAGNTTGFEFDAAAKSAAVAAIDGVTNDEATVVAAKAATDAYLSGEANEGDTFTLTTGADNFVGTAANDTFNALPVNDTGAVDTFSAFDSIEGGAGTDTLNIFATTIGTDRNEQFPSNATVNDVEVVNITWADNSAVAGSSLLNVSNYSGVEQLWQINASDDVTNATGDMTVGYRGIPATRLNDDITMATGETTANIALDNSVGSVDTNGATTVNVAGTKAAGTFTLNVNATGAATSVAVNTAVATTIATALGTVTTVDASASTGDITYTTTNDVSVSTGSGDDTVTVGSLAANATVNLGAGDDKLLGTGTVPATAMIDGGEGTDSAGSALFNAGNAGKFSNFENISLTGTGTLDLNLVTASTITGLSIDTANTASVTNATTNQSLTVTASGTTSSIGFTGVTGSSDTYTINFDAETTGTTAAPTTVDAGTVTVDGIENLNIGSGAAEGVAANEITLTASTLQTVTITGDQAATVDFAGTTGAATAGVSSIDGSAATGALDIDTSGITNVAAAGLSVKGGSDADMITVNTAATLTGNAGNDDFDVAGAVGTAEVVSIVDFTAGDKISFLAANSGTGFTATKIDISAATTLDQALDLADNTAGQVTWFDYGGSTYVVAADATAGDNTGDNIVKLAGGLDLSGATLAGNELTFA